MQRVLPMTLFAFAINRREIDSAMKPVFHDALKSCQRDRIAERGTLVVALRAVLREGRMIARNFS